VDDEGAVHYSTGLESVPARHRPAAQPLAPVRGPAAAQAAPVAIPFTPGAPLLVEATVNGAGPVVLVVDTGADRTMIAPVALARLGIPVPETEAVIVRGVTGTARADLVWLESLGVAGLTVGPIPVVAHDAGLREADGLLGRDFLARHTITIDTVAHVLTIVPR
jgi:predicted aspartyl protease